MSVKMYVFIQFSYAWYYTSVYSDRRDVLKNIKSIFWDFLKRKRLSDLSS